MESMNSLFGIRDVGNIFLTIKDTKVKFESPLIIGPNTTCQKLKAKHFISVYKGNLSLVVESNTIFEHSLTCVLKYRLIFAFLPFYF